jgi:hypothetical protein
MPHNSLKLIPGVDENRTPALNEAAISYSNLIRFIPDRQGFGLVQKLGGWTKWFTNPIGSIVRCLWAWEDTNNNSYLAIGAESSLNYIKDGTTRNLKTITPQTTAASSVSVQLSTVSGSDEVTVKQVGSNITSYDSVFIETQIAVGGLVIFGLYQCYTISPDTYKIYARDVLGSPALATSTVTNGGAVASYATTSGQSIVTVTLVAHGFSVYSNYAAVISTTVGGLTIFGNYTVLTVPTADTFTIQVATAATTTTTGSQNGGNAYYLYYIGAGPLPAGTGYGVLGYGIGGYGTGTTPTAATGTPITAVDWTLDNWGEILIACPYNGALYEWNPATNSLVATVIPNAPVLNRGAFVAMPQRQIVTWGSTFNGIADPLLIRWCDINNYNDWLANSVNQAGSYRIPKGSTIVQCIQGPQQGLIWTDLAIWAMQYVDLPFVYQFNELGNGCGLIGRKAAGSINGLVYWMSQSSFFRLGANGVEPVACPVWDVIFQDLDQTNLDKIRFAANSRFGEIAWYYPTQNNGGEINAYVKYNLILNQWDYGTLQRTAWINQSVLGPPIGADAAGYIYQHETSQNADGQPMNSSFQTGYFTLAEGDVKTFIDQVWPDMKWGYFGGAQGANVLLTFYVTDYPGATPIAYGPFTLTQATEYITPRFRGRLVSIKLESNDIDSFWRIGNIRYRFQPDGKF